MKLYRKRGLTRMHPWAPDLDMRDVTIDDKDRDRGSPKKGDMIAHDPKTGNSWLVAKGYFEENYEEAS
jgi:hypothetical protein